MNAKSKGRTKTKNAPENGGDVHASLAANIHEVGVGRLDQSALLVLGLLDRDFGVEEIVLNELFFKSKRKKHFRQYTARFQNYKGLPDYTK